MSSTASKMADSAKLSKSVSKEIKKQMSLLLRDRAKILVKLDKAEVKLEAVASKKKASASSAEGGNSSAASSVKSHELLSVAAAAELPEMLLIDSLLEHLETQETLLKALQKELKVLEKPAKPAKKPKKEGTWTPTSAAFAYRPEELYPEEFKRFQAESQPAKLLLKEQIAGKKSDDPELPALKKALRNTGSLPAFRKLCKESSHRAEWEAFKAAWKPAASNSSASNSASASAAAEDEDDEDEDEEDEEDEAYSECQIGRWAGK